jgi:hypothetical protein
MNRLLLAAAALWMFASQSTTLCAQTTSPRKGSTTIISNSGNGIGNTIIVSGADKASVKILNSRNGLGNQILVQGGKVIDLNKLRYPGKNKRFWTKQKWDRELATNLYWCPTTNLWFRYHGADDSYRPAVEVLRRETDRVLREVDDVVGDIERQLERLHDRAPR